MKNKILNTIYYFLLAVVLVPCSILSMVHLSDYYHSRKVTKNLPKSDETRRLEYYLNTDILYVDVDNYQIEFESSDRIMKFESFDSLAFYVGELSREESGK